MTQETLAPILRKSILPHPMDEPLPTGRLAAVVRDWECLPGFVQVPVKEIVANPALTMQARLIWMWLASLPPRGHRVSWGECEALFQCGVKARRSCLKQLVDQGLLTLTPDCVAILHSPYEAEPQNKQKTISAAVESYVNWRLQPDSSYAFQATERGLYEQRADKLLFDYFSSTQKPEKVSKPKEKAQVVVDIPIIQNNDTVISEETIEAEKIVVTEEEAPTEPPEQEGEKPLLRPLLKGSPYQLVDQEGILNAWNSCKPDTFASMRSVSIQQQKCITKHILNLGLTKDDAADFICSVCAGLKKTPFWTQQLPKQNRNFKSVFGYGDPNQTKMSNIETLYNAGLDEQPSIETKLPQPTKYTSAQQEEIDTLSYITLNLQRAKNAEDQAEIERWSNFRQESLKNLQNLKVDTSFFE